MALNDLNEQHFPPEDELDPGAGKPADRFLDSDETQIAANFLNHGHVIVPVEEREILDELRAAIVKIAAAHLDMAPPQDHDAFLNTIHQRVEPAALNAMRLKVINGVNAARLGASVLFPICT